MLLWKNDPVLFKIYSNQDSLPFWVTTYYIFQLILYAKNHLETTEIFQEAKNMFVLTKYNNIQ